MSNKDKLNCYLDLQRAAVALATGSRNAFEVFLKHGLCLLGERSLIAGQITQVVEDPKLDKSQKADKILTYGLMIKPRI